MMSRCSSPAPLRTALAATATTLSMGVGALLVVGCGSSASKPSIAKVEAKMRQDAKSPASIEHSLSSRQIHCLALTGERFATPAALSNFVDGKAREVEVPKKDKPAVKRYYDRCIKSR